MPEEQSLSHFLDELASAVPTPGGGGAAAVAGAMGAALISMVCNLTLGKKKFAGVQQEMGAILHRAEELRAELTRMIAEDAEVFEAVMAAYRLPRKDEEQQAVCAAAIEAASKQATLTPLKVARACAEVITLSRPALEWGNPNLVSDAGAAALCAQAGLKVAALNILINLAAIQDGDFRRTYRAELDEILAEHTALAEEVYELTRIRLT